MNLTKINNQISQETKDKIKEQLSLIKQYEAQFGKYKGSSMGFLFKEWHKLFPRQKQSINCSGCRKAVLKFFTLLNDNWENK
jgi:hypothetical protein